jgi:Peptidase_C39 like family
MLGWIALAAGLLLSSGTDAHVLDVPYRNQLDGSPYALANCGPTSLSMAMAYYGIDLSPWDLRVASMKAQHSWVTDEGGYSDRYGVFIYNLANAAERFGLHADGLWSRDGARTDRLHQWQPNELRRAIQADHPVIVEVGYRALPAHAASRATDDHFILVRGTVGADFVYSDPLGVGDSGPEQHISEADLSVAMAAAEAPRAAFALVKPKPPTESIARSSP